MKKITLLLNGLCIALAILSVFKGASSALLYFVIYGMSIGAVLTHQKRAYYYITMVLNGILLIVGLSLIFYDSSRVIKALSQEFSILIALFIMFLLTPILNLVYIKTKMIVLKRKSQKDNHHKIFSDAKEIIKNNENSYFDDLTGREFDWFAIDSEGNIGLFSTAGEGFIPNEVVENYIQYDTISESIDSPNWGSSEVWSDYAKLGFFVFDWSLPGGPYKKVHEPQINMDDELKNRILALTNLYEFKLNFNKTHEIIGS